MTLMEVLARGLKAVHRDRMFLIDMSRESDSRFFRRTFDGEEDDITAVRETEVAKWPWDGWQEPTQHDLDLMEGDLVTTVALANIQKEDTDDS